jgi:exopolyphosphatase / guanosine-5'-triphosphate,3'-diphosphate pyrophosphatase
MNVASIDIGSNTVLLLIAEINKLKKTFVPLLNVHRMPRVSKGLIPGNPIQPEKISLLRSVLSEYKILIDEYRVEKVIATATNAFRIASNSNEIIQEIKNEFNIEVQVITGEEEAYYSFLGATSAVDSYKEFLVIDIGGGSTEIITGSKEKLNFRKSFHIGAVSATEQFIKNDPPEPEQINLLSVHLLNILKEIEGLEVKNRFPIAIAGTPTTLTCIKHSLSDFDEKIIELSELTLNDLNEIAYKLSLMTSEQIKFKWGKIMRGREDIILAGSLILLNIVKLLNLDKVYTSTKGIRYGAIVKYLIES